MVQLAYGPDVPPAVVDQVEFHARSLGLPLHLLELMGSTLDRAEGFVVAAERGLGLAYAMMACYGEPFEAIAERGAEMVVDVLGVER